MTSSVVEHSPTMHEVLGSISSAGMEKGKRLDLEKVQEQAVLPLEGESRRGFWKASSIPFTNLMCWLHKCVQLAK